MSKVITLSKRMQSVADRISHGLRLADVGCDHGYLSIWLCQTDKIPSAIAMDVNKGPLLRAEQNVALYGLEDRISFRLSDGLMELSPGEVDSVAIAGMGGMLTIRILDAREDILAGIKELVLEPQSDVEGVRRYLLQKGFVITDEDFVFEDGKFYPIIRAVHKEDASEAAGSESVEEELQMKFGGILLQNRQPVLKEYLEKTLTQTEELIRRLEKKPTEKGLARAEELKDEVRCLKAALNCYCD